MAVTITAVTPRVTSASGVATITTASFTPTVGATLFAVASCDVSPATTAITITSTVDNSWTQVVRGDGSTTPTSNHAGAISSNKVVTSGARTVTASSTSAFCTSLQVYQVTVTGTLTLGATGNGGSTSANTTATVFTNTAAGSTLLLGAQSLLLTGSSVTSSDLTVTFVANTAVDDLAVVSGYKTMSGIASQSANFSATFSSTTWHWFAVELIDVPIPQKMVARSPRAPMLRFNRPENAPPPPARRLPPPKQVVRATSATLKVRPRRFVAATIPAVIVPNPDKSWTLIRDTRPLARTALRRGQSFDAPKPQTVAPPPYPPYRIKAANRIGIPRYVRRKPGESLRTFAPYQPVYPLPITIRNRDRRTWRRYVNYVRPTWPQAPAPFYPAPLKARIKPITPRWYRTRLEFTPNDQAKAPYFGVPSARPPLSKRGFKSKSKIFAAPAQQVLPVERRSSRRLATSMTRRRGLVAPSVEAAPLRGVAKRSSGVPPVLRRPRQASALGRLGIPPVVSASPVRRRIARTSTKARPQQVSQSPGYTNPVLVPRGRPETPFRAGVALRRGRQSTRGAWNNPIAPVFVPKWVRTRRMEGLRARLGRGQIIAPVIQVYNDIVFSIRPAPDSWKFGYTVDDWRFDDDNDNWMFWYAGG